jgi:hypothetical protein
MKIPRWTLRTVALFAAVMGAATSLAAQGVTTGAIGGTVTNDQGQPVEGAQIQVVDPTTGYRAGALTRRNGLYIIQGLEVGGRYVVSARRIGFAPQEEKDVRVTLSQTTRVNFTLTTQAAALARVTISSTGVASIISPTKTGVGKNISDSAVARLPTLTGNFTDFARLTPQVTTSGGGVSGGGANLRENSVQIDGAQESDLFGLGTTGVPGSQANAKSIPLAAVKEYQVLLSPFDVRQGNFSGVLINAVTKGGTNEFTGSALFVARDQKITRTQSYLTDFKQRQYNFSFGGPIVKDKAFFFIAPAWGTQNRPASGTFLGQTGVPIDQPSIDAVNAAIRTASNFEGGGGNLVQVANPLTNLFARVDVNLPWSSRLVVRHNYGLAKQDNFFRSDVSVGSPTFNLTSNLYAFTSKKNASVLQLFSSTDAGLSNEFSVGLTTIRDFRTVPVAAPQISIRVPRTVGTGTVNVVAGTERSSQGNELDQDVLEISDNFSFPIRSHTFNIGTKNLFYKVRNLFGQDRYGTWAFNSIDSLKGTCATCGGQSRAASYSVAVPAVVDEGLAKFKTALYGVYAQDLWAVTPNVNVTYGIRADIPVFNSKPPFNPAVADSFGRRTDQLPSGTIQWSPRLGVNWDMQGNGVNQLRFGAGLFTGMPPYVWLGNAFQNSGLSGYATLTCGSNVVTNANYPPAFSATPPTKCGGTNANPASAALGGRIALLNEDLRFPQDLKASIGYDHRFSWGFLENVIGTVEALYGHAVYHPYYLNLANAEPVKTDPTAFDRNGRLMYGTISGTGFSTKTIKGRTEVYDIINSNKDYNYSITGSLNKRFYDNWEGGLSYTYQQARDVQSILNTTPNSSWRQGSNRSTSQYDQILSRSRWEQPHRVIANGTYAFQRTNTDVTFVYTGESGMTFDYTYNADENADGATNDLIYVPRNVRDLNEIKFTGYNVAASAASVANQQAAFDSFINSVKCLRNQRGQIMTRSSCRSPWQNGIDLSIRQGLPVVMGNRIALQWDVFNFGNLLNKNWGWQRTSLSTGLPGAFLLTRTATTTDAAGKTQGIYTFDTNTQRDSYQVAASNYRMQLTLKYSF